MYFQYPFGRPEESRENWINAVYLVSGADYANILRRSGNYAVGQSVGTWLPVPGITETMIKERQARVTGVYAGGGDTDTQFIIRVAFPTVNFGRCFTMLLTALLGNDVSTALNVRLLDIEVDNPAGQGFSGPKKGIADLRALTNISNRPLVLNMIKPCAGFSPKDGAKLFYDVALGGVDLVKDDELLASPSYCNVRERAAAYFEAAKAAEEKTGKHTLYLPNISGSPKNMRENAKAVIDAGAKACLVNYVFGGLDALMELCDEFGDDLFIMGHYAGVSSFGGSTSGISDALMVGLLPRLAGVSALMTMYPKRDDSKAMFEYFRTIQAQSLPLNGLAPVVTAVGGGVTPMNQKIIQDEIGKDCIIGIGGAIQGHPMGTTQGAIAAMAAVKATAEGTPLEQASGSCPALAKAIEVWAR
jgi:2,3-diketo-5-methylthiopentyl-1-phosphate enolase